MDTSHVARLFGAVDLDGALAALGHSTRACTCLRQAMGKAAGESAVTMLKTGSLSGDVGDRIRDFFTDEIENEATPVWSAVTYDPDDEGNPDTMYPLEILEYERIYFVFALEHDPVGYFLTLDEAKSFALGNWENVKEPAA